MDDAQGARPPVWFWVVSVAALLWALVGCSAYYSQVTISAADMAALPQAQREIWAMTPAWVMGAYAIAVWIGLAGAVALLIRRRIARTLYVVSLLAVIVQFGWIFLATPILDTVGPSSVIFPLVIATIGAALIWFAGRGIDRGWLR